MGRAWECSLRPGRDWPFILVVCVGVCAAMAAAQNPAVPPKPHASPVPRLIILPPELLAGQPATLAVIDSQGRLLPKATVELSAGQHVTTDATGRALFIAPAEPGTLIAKFAGQTAATSAPVVAAGGADTAASAASSAAKVLSYPHVLAVHDRFTIEGAGFRGAAESNRVFLNGEPCLVVAASPVSLVVLPGPQVPIGDVNLRVSVAGTDAGQFQLSAVLLEISGPAEAVNAGSEGELVVHARGTSEPLLVEVRNASPAVIQLANGNVQRLKTSGGEENSAPVAVKFVTGGNYAVTARLISGSDVAKAKVKIKSRQAEACPTGAC
ncbi:MAG TPA: IPT/TIG domain-containing protein [Candidatus Acidoferrales bacterium]|nr:IPT/TIG domain-containing protein [Candidatus Acidoferrales bacterium]